MTGNTIYISAKHKSLFDAGAEALNKALPNLRHPVDLIENVDRQYMCPICRKCFSENSILKSSPDTERLTLEHVPPKSVGGAAICLTCKKCNNSLGSSIDAHLAKKNDFQKLFRRDKPKGKKLWRAKLIRNGITVQASVSKNKRGGLHFGISPQNNPPKNTSTAFFAGIESDSHFSFEVTMRAYSTRKADRALLKSAYLCLFSKFGYHYILSKPILSFLERVRFPEKVDAPIAILRNATPMLDRLMVFDHSGICLVPISDDIIFLPWVNSDINQFDIFADAVSKGPKGERTGISGKGIPFDMPKKIESVLDHE